MNSPLVTRTTLGVLLAMQILPAHAEGLCATGETTYFSCQTTKQRSISLCGKMPRELQYRFGMPGKVELSFPGNAKDSAKAFEFAHYFRFQTDRTEVSFRNGDVDFAVFDYSEDDRTRHAGVRVTANRKDTQLVCTGKITSRLAKLEGVLRCDPDKALNMGTCREPSP